MQIEVTEFNKKLERKEKHFLVMRKRSDIHTNYELSCSFSIMIIYEVVISFNRIFLYLKERRI